MLISTITKMIRRRIPRRMGKLRTEGNGMGKRRRRLISIPLLSSFSTSKGFRSSHGSDLEEEEEEEQRGTTLAFPTIFAIPTYKKKTKKEGSSKPLDLRHHSICHTSFFSPSHPRGCGGQKWRKFCTQPGGEGNLWHRGGGFPKRGEKR